MEKKEKQQEKEPKRTNKSWEAFMKSQGTVIVNDPTLLI